MATDQVTTRGHTLDFGLLIALLLRQRVRRFPDGLGLRYSVWHGTCRSLLHDNPSSGFRVEGKEVAPYALLDFIFYLIGKRGIGVDELRGGKSLSILGRRRDALILRRKGLFGGPMPDLAGSSLGGFCGGLLVAFCLVGDGGG